MSTDISDMSRSDIIRALEQLVFTAARDWRRTVTIDRNTRDILVAALSETRIANFGKDTRSA